MTNIEMLEKISPGCPLKLIAMESCQALGQKVNDYIVSFRENTINEVTEFPPYISIISPTIIWLTAVVRDLDPGKQKVY